jgi:hypothetical protein
MQIVTGAFGDENNLLPHMTMLAGALAGRKELHIGFDAALLGIETVVNEVLDEPVGATLEGHIPGTNDVETSLVIATEFLGCQSILGAEVADFRADLRYVSFI